MVSEPIKVQPGDKHEQIANEFDEMSKKRISLHKVERHNPLKPDEVYYSYHMVIIDAAMTINIELSQSAIINLVNSMKQ